MEEVIMDAARMEERPEFHWSRIENKSNSQYFNGKSYNWSALKPEDFNIINRRLLKGCARRELCTGLKQKRHLEITLRPADKRSYHIQWNVPNTVGILEVYHTYQVNSKANKPFINLHLEADFHPAIIAVSCGVTSALWWTI